PISCNCFPAISSLIHTTLLLADTSNAVTSTCPLRASAKPPCLSWFGNCNTLRSLHFIKQASELSLRVSVSRQQSRPASLICLYIRANFHPGSRGQQRTFQHPTWTRFDLFLT